MATQQAAHPRDGSAPRGHSLPFRSRSAADRINEQDARALPSDRIAMAGSTSSVAEQNASLKSRLDCSPTSVIEQARDENCPSSPSPVCSPSPSSSSKLLLHSSELVPYSPLPRARNSAEVPPNVVKDYSKEGGSTSETPETWEAAACAGEGSSENSLLIRYSSTSESGLLALLASKLFSNRELKSGLLSKRTSRYSGESSGTIYDKHITEDDRSSKPPVEEIDVGEHPWQTGAAHHRRVPSDTQSEISLGSANDRSLSMEFNAVLAAATAAGVEQARVMRNRDERDTSDWVQLPGIIEDYSSVNSFSDELLQTSRGINVNENDRQFNRASFDDRDLSYAYALVPVTMGVESNAEPTSTALTIRGQVGQPEGNGRRAELQTETFPALPQSFGSSSPRSRESIPDLEMLSISSQSSHSSINGGQDTLARALNNDRATEVRSGSRPLSSNSSKQNLSSNPRQLALQQVRRSKIFAKALAYEEAKSAKYENRYQREATKILAWENQQRIKANVSMKKVEMKLEAKRAKAYEKMQNQIALAHKRAEEKKATAEAIRCAKVAKAVEGAEKIRRTEKVTTGCLPLF
eukprot:c27995_g1_i1 orf=499-2238(-)